MCDIINILMYSLIHRHYAAGVARGPANAAGHRLHRGGSAALLEKLAAHVSCKTLFLLADCLVLIQRRCLHGTPWLTPAPVIVNTAHITPFCVSQLHSTIFETEFIVDLQKIQEENFKLTVLQDYSSTSGGGSKGFRGSNITMASSFLGMRYSAFVVSGVCTT